MENEEPKKSVNFIVFVACLGAILSSLTSCATTYSVNYASTEQPRGIYKYAVISASSFGGSVLQRFYSEYPSDKYEVVAYETQRKHYLPFLLGFGGALLGGAAGSIIGGNSNMSGPEAVRIGAGVGAPIFGSIGYLFGTTFKDKYIVTYIER